MKTITKRLYLLPDGSMSDLSDQIDAPLRSITSEHLARINELQAGPDKPLVWATGGGYSYAPTTEGVPDIPGRPTVTVERAEPVPIPIHGLLSAVITAVAVGAGLVWLAWAVHTGQWRI